MEIWKDINGYEEIFQVSNLGNFKRLNTKIRAGVGNSCLKEHKINGYVNKKGYQRLCLSKNGKSASMLAHRLVAETFILNPQNKPQVNHIDGNKLNNNVENLEWCTNAENAKHTAVNFIQKRKLTKKQILFIRSSNLIHKELAKMFNVSRRYIGKIKKRQRCIYV